MIIALITLVIIALPALALTVLSIIIAVLHAAEEMGSWERWNDNDDRKGQK